MTVFIFFSFWEIKAPDRKSHAFGQAPAICSLEGPETKETREGGPLEGPKKGLVGLTIANYLRAAIY